MFSAYILKQLMTECIEHAVNYPSSLRALLHYSVCYRGHCMAAQRSKFIFKCWETLFNMRRKNFISLSDHVIFFLFHKILRNI